MYGSGIKALDNISGELEGNSRSTFVDLNSEVSKHASALEDVSISSFISNFILFLLLLTSFVWFSYSKELLQKPMHYLVILKVAFTSKRRSFLHMLNNSERFVTSYHFYASIHIYTKSVQIIIIFFSATNMKYRHMPEQWKLHVQFLRLPWTSSRLWTRMRPIWPKLWKKHRA